MASTNWHVNLRADGVAELYRGQTLYCTGSLQLLMDLAVDMNRSNECSPPVNTSETPAATLAK